MADLLFIAILVAFFALAVVFVRACERILGGVEDEVVEVTDTAETDLVTS